MIMNSADHKTTILTNKVFYLIGIFTLFIGIFFLLYYFYLLYWPYPVLEIKKPIAINKTIYKPGEIMIVIVNYCKHADYNGEHIIKFVSITQPPLVLHSESTIGT